MDSLFSKALMDYDNHTPTLFLIEILSIRQRQELITQQRCENPTDAHLQLVMDRQQERLDRQQKELAAALAEIAINN